MSLQMPDAVHAVAEAYKHDMLEKRDDTLCEVLSMITDKLDPTGDVPRQLVLVEILRAVNAMRDDDAAKQSDVGKEKINDVTKK